MLLPQCQWDGELYHYAKVMLADHRQSHADAKDWRLLDPPRDHPAILAWLEQRLLHLWREKRARQAVRVQSAKQQAPPSAAELWSGDGWAPLSACDTPRGVDYSRGPVSPALSPTF
jgi:hypothetical protein